MTEEHRLMNEIMIALAPHGAVFRTNSGDFWQGKRAFSTEFKQEVLTHLRKVKGLPKGFSDLLFIGNNGKIAFIEVKTKTGRISPEQQNFLQIMQKLGYNAGVARSVSDAIKIILTEETQNGI